MDKISLSLNFADPQGTHESQGWYAGPAGHYSCYHELTRAHQDDDQDDDDP